MSQTYITRTHLGGLLKPGDHATGYFLAHRNFNNDQFAELQTRIQNTSRHAHLGGGIPDVVLVKKAYPHARKKNKNRSWRLKNLAMEKEDEVQRGKNAVQTTDEMDYELFLRDIEEDEELRGMVNLYKDTRQVPKDHAMMSASEDEGEVEEDFPQINVDDLLEDMEALQIQDGEGDIVM